MKKIYTKLLIVVFLALGISSFVVLSNPKSQIDNNETVDNVRFNSEMDHGFSDREAPF